MFFLVLLLWYMCTSYISVSFLECAIEIMKPLGWWPVCQERDESCLITAQETGLFHCLFVWKEEFKKEKDKIPDYQ